MNFGEKLKKLRKEAGITQKELADAMGLFSRTISNYEVSKSHPQDRAVYFELAKFFNVDVNYLLTENDEFLSKAAERYGRKGHEQAKILLEDATALFAGGELSENDKLGFLHDIQAAYLMSKDLAREKYTPKKYKNAPYE